MAVPVRLEMAEGAAVLTLARPEAGNRLDMETVTALEAASAQLAGAADLRALLIRAEGRMFSVGGAINEFGTTPDLPACLAAILEIGHRAMGRLFALPCPVVTAVQGPAGGAGIGLALCGDIALAAPGAVFRAGYPALGMSADFGASWLLARLGGARLAADMLLTNRTVAAEEAMARGLLTAIHPAGELDTAARALLARLAAGPARAQAAACALVRAAGARDAIAHMEAEAAAMLAAAATADAAEGIAAFLAKRAPVFQGR
ncbi:MAG: enoyl-CoA hydratase/isomerase family protein [Rhodobacter sp.]|nr:enoyl-CoA hydratase/isomerase family protein [Rhodobacter sp.]MCA3451231.1 enoyl-CoA hydratase/isomerase family protein [Rhodobacter sp.]